MSVLPHIKQHFSFLRTTSARGTSLCSFGKEAEDDKLDRRSGQRRAAPGYAARRCAPSPERTGACGGPAAEATPFAGAGAAGALETWVCRLQARYGGLTEAGIVRLAGDGAGRC